MHNRRKHLQWMFSAPWLLNATIPLFSRTADEHKNPRRFQPSLNAYSFNGPLTRKEITLPEVIRFCRELDLDAIDLTLKHRATIDHFLAADRIARPWIYALPEST